jgi:hypothetical protein
MLLSNRDRWPEGSELVEPAGDALAVLQLCDDSRHAWGMADQVFSVFLHMCPANDRAQATAVSQARPSW